MKIYRHKKRGTKYALISTGTFQSNNIFYKTFNDVWLTEAFKSLDMIEVAVYISLDDGKIWVRPMSEWTDGRFELVSE